MNFQEGYMLASIGAVIGGAVGALTAYLWGFYRGWAKCSDFHHAMNEELRDSAIAAVNHMAEEARKYLSDQKEQQH